ncbi:MAG TPA: ABC transporter permease [Burkholderiales bacterium]|nr:ABC transporter permease [Burkholderiales bacterium]
MNNGAIRELWAYRELAYFLAWRDVKVRYKQTALGVLWAVIQPFFTMVIFTVLFGQLAKIPTDGIPGPVFYFSALVPWIYFSTTVTNAGMSLVTNAGLLTKIYFPRIILPVAAAISNLVDFLIGSALFIGFIVYYKIPLGWSLLLWPLLVVLLVLLALSLGLFLAALNVKYRDFRYAIPFLIQLLLFGTPIIYPASMIPEKFKWVLAVNPMSGVIEGFRYALVPSRTMHWDLLWISVAATAVLFIAGVAYFRRAERAFADIV